MSATQQVSRRAGTPNFYQKTVFTDHTGQEAVRIRYATSTSPRDTRPWTFCLQAYSAISLDRSPKDIPLQERCLKDRGSAIEANLLSLLEYLIDEISEGNDRPPPALQVYVRHGITALQCVDHQRREIAYRKSRRGKPDVALIPKVASSPVDSRRSGFLYLVNSAGYQKGRHSEGVSEQAPYTVRFDRRMPLATGAETALRWAEDPEELDEEEDNVILPEKLEIEVTHELRPDVMRRNITFIYDRSWTDEDEPDFAEDEDEGDPNALLSGSALATVRNLAQPHVDYDDFEIEGGSNVLTVSNSGSAEPHLRYAVYISFLNLYQDKINLEQVAKAYAVALRNQLPSETSFTIHFSRSSASTLQEILTKHTELFAAKPSGYIGTSYNQPAFPIQPNELTYQPTEPPPPRIYPCTRTEQLPINLSFQRYRTFLIVLDRPDFLTAPGTLFLMTDGGRNKGLPGQQHGEVEGGPTILGGPTSAYQSLQVWRSRSFDAAVSRLAMRGH